MEYDKVIDSEQLDSALTTTAKAIRLKTGDIDKIAWDMDNGFKEAVDAIKTEKPEQEKAATPTKDTQEVRPDTGYVMNKVTVNPIPDQYADVSGVTAVAEDVVYGKTIVGADGSPVNGTLGYRKYTGEVVSTIVGFDAFVELTKDDLLAELRSNENLSIVVTFDIDPTTPNTILQAFGFNKLGQIPGWNGIRGLENYQYFYRYATSEATINAGLSRIDVKTSSGTGHLYITEDGTLHMYSNSKSTYAIRPSTFVVEVRW